MTDAQRQRRYRAEKRRRGKPIKGLWVLSSHWHTEPGELRVYEDPPGSTDWHAAGFEDIEELGGIIAQECFERLGDQPEVYILIDCDFARFIADPGECERVGMPVDRLAIEAEEQP